MIERVKKLYSRYEFLEQSLEVLEKKIKEEIDNKDERK